MARINHLMIRVTAEEAGLFRAAGKWRGVTAAGWARQLLIQEARKVLAEEALAHHEGQIEAMEALIEERAA